jgi:ABC-type transport system substrate-binding protein
MISFRPARRLVLVPIVLALLWLAAPAIVAAAPEGTLTIALHFTPVTRWLDPAEGESTITPYLLLHALHDGLLKPMPGVGSGPSLAESWSMARDMLSADFALRDRKKREALLHQMQRILYEQVVQAVVYHLGFPIRVGPRVEDIMATSIPGFYMSPYEDLKLRR